MKIEFNENDLDYMERINADIRNGTRNVPLFMNEGDTYYINFTCKDVAKAHTFIIDLIQSLNNGLSESVGIEVNSVNLCEGDTKISELKDLLKSFMERLDTL